ncbi:MAG: DUF4230 domain-containing protein [Eubacterium sp.]|nr:DUF4230 domain-containing protein [Eubacterium sp.]
MSRREYQEMLREERRKRKNMKKTFLLIIGVLLFAFALSGLGLYIGYKLFNKKEKKPEITSAFISSKIEEVSDLTAAEMTYNGIIYYKEGDIPFITQKSYNMSYTAEVRAGIDVSEVKVNVVGNTVVVKLPDTEIQSIDVDPNSVNFYDEKHALFNWDTKKDGVEAIKNAEADVEQNADLEELKSKATKNSKEIIESIIKDAVDEDTQVVVD